MDGSVAMLQMQFTTQVDALPEGTTDDIVAIAERNTSASGITALPSKSLEAMHPPISGHEAIGLGIALLVLLMTLGSLWAAGLPIITALIGVAIGVGGAFALSGKHHPDDRHPGARPHDRARRRDRLRPVHRQPAAAPHPRRRSERRRCDRPGRRHGRQCRRLRGLDRHHRPRRPDHHRHRVPHDDGPRRGHDGRARRPHRPHPAARAARARRRADLLDQGESGRPDHRLGGGAAPRQPLGQLPRPAPVGRDRRRHGRPHPGRRAGPGHGSRDADRRDGQPREHLAAELRRDHPWLRRGLQRTAHRRRPPERRCHARPAGHRRDHDRAQGDR